MKIFMLIISLLFGFLTTSHAQMASDFRIWSGVLYNVQKSVKWVTLPPEDHGDGVPFIGNARHVYWSYKMKVTHVFTNAIVVRCYMSSGVDSGQDPNWENQIIVIKNHPKQNTLTVGTILERDRFLQIENTQLTHANGAADTVVKCYTYGLPNTTENRKTLKNP